MSESDSKLLYTGIAILLAVLFLGTKRRYRCLYILFKTLPRDVRGIILLTKVIYRLRRILKNKESIPKCFQKQVAKSPNKVAFYFEDEAWTFKQIEDFSNKVANYFKEEGYEPGESVALLLENRPEYVGIWLGLSKIGVVAALINTNLVSAPLAHSINTAHSKAVIYGSDFETAIRGAKEKFGELKLYRFVTSKAEVTEDAVDLKAEVENASQESPTELISKTLPADKLLYIFTSGTTGLPKAAVISHARFAFASLGLYVATDGNDSDILYNPLPLYHSAGGMVALGQTLLFGITTVIRRKFSASNFWKDCVRHNCTMSIYIGEICRYILAAHDGKSKIVHKVRRMAGNGLRKEVWEQFQKTFDIPQIIEFYGSTEGNAHLVNLDGTVGAVGFLPAYGRLFFPLCLIQCDEDTNEPIRNSRGFCVMCEVGQPGLLVRKIGTKNAMNEFIGYADRKETNKKIIRDVFRRGDQFFNSGDILVQDEFRNFYFKDRTGDTFRWKGENVATTEVESVIETIVGLKTAAVYGVEVPNAEGRAGMVTIADPNKNVDIQKLAKGLKDHLPGYAIPLFLRLADALPMTGTFKVRKVELQKQGYDLSKIKEPVYFYVSKQVAYVPLENVYSSIVDGKMKL